MKIGSRSIGPDYPPFIVAELSGNHNGSLKRLLALVDAAANAGADAVKLQTYTPETMTLNLDTPDFVVDKGPWAGETLWSLYEQAQTPWAWHAAVRDRCRALGVEFFSTPFDLTAVAFLEELGVPAYKIASFEIGDLDLIRACARTGKPILVSTGMASADEITLALRAAGRNAVFLHCISDYPAQPARMDLGALQRLPAPVGLSDHSPGHAAAVAAVVLGACVIEKHVCLARRHGGVDAAFSMEPHEFKEMAAACRDTWRALRAPEGPVSVQGNDRYRRSLWVVRDVAAGELFTRENVRALRPGYGAHPAVLEQVLNCRASVDVPAGTPMSLSLLT